MFSDLLMLISLAAAFDGLADGDDDWNKGHDGDKENVENPDHQYQHPLLHLHTHVWIEK